jgi:predicted acyltransferase
MAKLTLRKEFAMHNTTTRLQSIDALRGLTVAAMLVVNDAGDWGHVYPWIEHADWFGCTFADFIFPFFMLIVGVSISLAYGDKIDSYGSKDTGSDTKSLARTILLRGLRIFLLGVALHLVASWTLHGREFRLLGVLQRIGICFAAIGLLSVYVRNARTQWLIFGGILLGYWALLVLSGPLTPDMNLADRIDTVLLGHLAYVFDPTTGKAHDPEGILSTLPSLATVLLGVRAGAWLRADQRSKLVFAGIIGIVGGGIWAIAFPLCKQLWTSSFVLWTGGFGLLAIALVHYLIDVRGLPALGRSMGINAIAAYAGSWLATCALEGSGIMQPLYATLFEKPLLPNFGPFVPSFAFALAFAAAFWAVMAYMQKRGWRITI